METSLVKGHRASGTAILFISASLVFSITPAWAQHLVSSAGDSSIVIDAGSSAGIRADMTGQIMTSQVIAGGIHSLWIADFRVVSADLDRCEAKLTKLGPGWRVESGMAVVFDQTLSPEPDSGVIIIRSNVAGDVAWIDGRRLGPTPQRIEVNAGNHVVRVEKSGFVSIERQVDLTAGQELTVRAAFIPPAPTAIPSRVNSALIGDLNPPSEEVRAESPPPTSSSTSPLAETKDFVNLGKADPSDAIPVRFVPSEEITPPVFMRGPRPDYPEAARLARVQGVVLLECVIGNDGSVTPQKVIRGLPLGLTEAASEAVRDWEFEPATKDGTPVEVLYVLAVRFSLESPDPAPTD